MNQPRNRSGKTLLILLVGCGLVALGAGIFAGVFFARRAQAGSAHGQGKRSENKHQAREMGTTFSLGEFVVNLADTSTLRYAKATVALGFIEKVPEEKLKENEPVLRDIIIEVMTRKSFVELHRRGGIQKLKRDLRIELSHRIPDATVGEVYFESFAMQ